MAGRRRCASRARSPARSSSPARRSPCACDSKVRLPESEMELRILGPVEATEGTAPIPLGPPKQRAVLARLALDANPAVRGEQLLDELWGDEMPDSAPKMVQIYVSQLRRALPADRLQTHGRGYR